MPFGIINGMKTELSIDKAGRVVLPQAVRRQFHLVAGDHLDLQIFPDGIFLHAQIKKLTSSKKMGYSCMKANRRVT